MKIEIKSQKIGKGSYLATALQGKISARRKTEKESREECARKVAIYLDRLAEFAPCMRKAKDGTMFVFELNEEGFGYIMVRDPEKYASSPACYYDAKSVKEAKEIMLRHFEQYNQACTT